MSEPFKLVRAPIIEAVLDIDCAMSPGFELSALENLAREIFRESYPKLRQQFFQEHQFEATSDAPPKVSVRHGLQAFQFLQTDEKQLIQIRTQGFSFNRLAPYGSLDDYLPEIERTWNLFRSLASLAQIRVVRLRYINRIDLPMIDGNTRLEDYIRDAPQIPAGTNLSMAGFLNQRFGLERDTGYEANIVMTSQAPQANKLPLILDICVAAKGLEQPENWTWISEKIMALRVLKNRIFKNTLTEQCLNLFQPSVSASQQDSRS